MRSGISITLSDSERQRLDAIVADRNAPQKHVWRARIVLLSSDGFGPNAIISATSKVKTCVWRCRNALLPKAWMDCCGTRPVHPASRRLRPAGGRGRAPHAGACAA